MTWEFAYLGIAGTLIFFALMACALAVWLLVRLAQLAGLRQEVADLEDKLTSFRNREAAASRRGNRPRSTARGNESQAESPTDPANFEDEIAARKKAIERGFRV